MVQREQFYVARWVFPIVGPPIHNGGVRVVDGTIVDVGTKSRIGGDANAIDLGDVALLPSLVNSHTHLEFSDCRQVIGQPGIPLAKWIGQVIAARGKVDQTQRDENVARGIQESIRCGVGLIGDISTPPTAYPNESVASVVSFSEVLGLSPERADERLLSAARHCDAMKSCDEVTFGVSPHSPYSTPFPLVESCVAMAIKHNAPVAMHLAESPDERTLLVEGAGPFADSLRQAGLWQPGLFPTTHREPVMELISILAKAPRALLIHGNDLTSDEIHSIAKHPHLSVVYCPRTHDFFGYDHHPVQQLLDAGVRVAIGTDSRASNPDLSVWREVQFLLNRRGDLPPCEILRMATESGADALLGRGSSGGRIVPGKPCERAGSFGVNSLMTVRTVGDTTEQVYRDFAENDCQWLKLSSL